MKRKLVIFGTGDIAELASYYFGIDSDYDVVAFAVDSEYISENTFCGLPVVPFEDVVNIYPPDEMVFFVALSYSKLNFVRMEKFKQAKSLGYKMASYISSKATIFSNVKIGENCFVLENNTIQPFVTIGDNVTLWSGNHIGHHSIIHNHSFIASHVVISGGVTIGEQCFLGVNATLRDHINVGNKSVVGAGVLLLSDAKDESLYIGSATQPSKIPSTKLKKI